MNTNIFVPEKINVGYQLRCDTYTGKLAYVTYFDQNGKLRKEKSWNNWRNENLGNDIFNNEPIEGFVLNKKAGGVEESWGWDVRKTYTRVYDPRGFEIEITVPNLIWILECCNSIKGKGLEGKFVYGWDKKELVLVPVDSPDYQEIKEKTEIIKTHNFLRPSELVLGHTYEMLDGSKWVYMGRHNYWYKKTSLYNNTLDDTWVRNPANPNDIHYYVKYIAQEKEYWFIHLGDPNEKYEYLRTNAIDHFKSINKKFTKCVDVNTNQFAEHQKMLDAYSHYSPIDFEKSKIVEMTFEQFKELIDNRKYHFYINQNNTLRSVYPNYYFDDRICKINDMVAHNEDDLRAMFEMIHPAYGEEYCVSGELCRRFGI